MSTDPKNPSLTHENFTSIMRASSGYEEARWRWVLQELAPHVPRVTGGNVLQAVRPKRHEEPGGNPNHLIEHLAWMTRHAPISPELRGKPDKAMRWACWAQGAMVALGLLPLAECKRLNMRATWSEACAAAGAEAWARWEVEAAKL